MKPNIKLAINELHRAFHELNNKYYFGKLPEPAILIQNAGNRKNVLGWCTVNPIWEDTAGAKKYEINLVAEYLNRGTHAVMTTLLHEMVHLYCRENDIKEVSRGGAYHNKTFKEIAESHGLVIESKDDKIGWSHSKLNSEAYFFIDRLEIKPEAFTLARKFTLDKDGKPKKKKTNSYKYACCGCGTSVRATKQVKIACADDECEKYGYIMEWVNQADFVEPEDEEKEQEENLEPETAEVVCGDCGCVNIVEILGGLKCPECDSDNVSVI